MRTLTSGQVLALSSAHRTVKARVFVDISGSGTFADLTILEGYDWVLGVSYDEAVDAPVAAATVQLARTVHDLSLSPLMGYSKLNNNNTAALMPSRRIYIEQQTLTIDAPVASAAWVRVFDGYIDEIDPSGEIVTLACRDLGARLVDTFIETETVYGTDSGRALHLVMQDIINNHLNTPGYGSVTLYTPTTPTFLVFSYKQDKVTIMDALTALADQAAMAVRYKWDSGTSAFRLTLYSVDRTKTTADYTFGPDDYYDLSQMKIGIQNIRNTVDVFFTDRANQVRASVQVTNDPSISKYGRRYMALTEASSSQIDTTTEATAFATAVCLDLCEPNADHAIVVDYFFPGELGDLYAFLPNAKHYDSTQKFAVINIAHEITGDGKATSTITTRGKPATAYRRWLRIEGRPGVAPGSGYLDPTAPTGVLAYSTVAGVVIEYDPPDRDTWAHTDVFLDTSGISDPGTDGTTGKHLPVSKTLLVASGKLTRFVVGALTLGQRYFGRIQVIDFNGNRSAASPQFTVVAQKVGPTHVNTDTAVGESGLLLNSDLNIYNAGIGDDPDSPVSSVPPDFWSASAWSATGTSPHAYVTTTTASGNYAVKLTNPTGSGLSGQSPYILSDFVPFSENDVISCAMFAKSEGSGTPSAVLFFDFYDKDRVQLSGPDGSTGGTPMAVGAEYSLVCQLAAMTPTGTRYFRVRAQAAIDENASIYVDRVGVTRGKPQLAAEIWRTGGEIGYDDSSLEEDTDYTLDTGHEVIYVNAGWVWNATDLDWTALLSGNFVFAAACSFKHTNIDPANNWAWLSIELNREAGAGWEQLVRIAGLTDDAGNMDMACRSPTVAVTPGCKVRVRYRSTESGRFQAVNKPGYFSGDCISRGDK